MLQIRFRMDIRTYRKPELWRIHQIKKPNQSPPITQVLHISHISESCEKAAAFFYEKGDFMQKILHQTKRAHPSADKSSKQASEQKEKSQRAKRNLKSSLIQQCLKRTDGTGRNCPRAGITIQTGNTGIFQTSPVYPSLKKTIYVSICNYCKK